MTGHLSDEQIELYRSRSLPPENIVSMSDHLISCDGCFQRVRRGEPAEEWVSIRLEESSAGEQDRLKAELQTGGLGAGLSADAGGMGHDLYYRQIERYVDEEMPGLDRSRFELHLESCRICREEVADLLELKASMASAQDATRGVESQRVAREEGVGSTVAVSWYRRPIPIWGGAAASLLLALVVSLVVSLPVRREVQRLREQVGTLEKETTEIQEQAKADTQDVKSRLKDLENRGPSDEEGPRVASGAPVTLHDGGRVIELRDGSLKGLESAPVNSQKAVELALESSRVAVPPIGTLLGKPSTLMGPPLGGGSFSVTSPVGTVIEQDKPLFSWTAAPGAVTYTVIISGVKSHRLFRSPPIHQTEWRATEPLPRGEIYTWEVQATLDDAREISAPAPPAPAARFKVVGASDEKAIREALRLNPRSHLLMGVLYAKAGLEEAARRELASLVEENPGSTVARNLSRSVAAGQRKQAEPDRN